MVRNFLHTSVRPAGESSIFPPAGQQEMSPSEIAEVELQRFPLVIFCVDPIRWPDFA